MTALTPVAASTYTPRRALILAAIAVGAALVGTGLGVRYGHAPNWGLLLAQAPVLHLHIAAALTALILGTVQLVGVKGTGAHRVIGWGWVVAMATVAISSFFIRMLNPGAFSWIHLLSGWTLIALPMALVAVRRGRIRNHARGMTLTFIGGLIIAGGFTFLPGRLLWKVFFG